MSRDASESVQWNKSMLEDFKKVYEEQCDDQIATFYFRDYCFVCGYAKYLIEYLEGVFNA
jgi:hypothetical protein